MHHWVIGILLWLIWGTLVFAFGLIGLLMGAFAGDAPQNNRRAGRLLSVTLGVFAVTTLLGFVLISRRDSWLDVLGALALTPVHLGVMILLAPLVFRK